VLILIVKEISEFKEQLIDNSLYINYQLDALIIIYS